MSGIGECDFETSWCGWRDNSTRNNSRWHRSKDEDHSPSESLPSG